MEHFIIQFDYWLKNTLIHLFRYFLFNRKFYKQKINRIIVFRTGSMGDSICTMPVILTIRKNFPSAFITLLSVPGKSKSLALYNLLDQSVFDDYIDYSELTRKQLIHLLKSKPYDLFIELPQTFASLYTNLRNMLFVRFLGIRHAFGWEVYSTRLLKKAQNEKNHFLYESYRLLKILKKNGLAPAKLEFPLNIGKRENDKILQYLSDLKITDKSRNVALVPGAKRETNRWPADYYEKLILFLIHQNLNIIFVGGPEDKEFILPFLNLPHVFDTTGLFTPLESAELLKHCLFTVSNDTGPMHLSYAVGTPVIALFSNRDYPRQWFPPDTVLNFVFRAKNIPCTICLRETCNNHKLCMTEIKPDSVIEKTKEFIAILSHTNNHE